jgi:hypothetical protein
LICGNSGQQRCAVQHVYSGRNIRIAFIPDQPGSYRRTRGVMNHHTTGR